MCIIFSDEELNVIVESNNWRIEGGVIFIRGQEEVIKPKRILAKIDFESQYQIYIKNNYVIIFV